MIWKAITQDIARVKTTANAMKSLELTFMTRLRMCIEQQERQPLPKDQPLRIRSARVMYSRRR